MKKFKTVLILCLSTMLIAAFATTAFAAETTEVSVKKTLHNRTCEDSDNPVIPTEYEVTIPTVSATYTNSASKVETILPGVTGGLYVKSGNDGKIIFSASDTATRQDITDRTASVLGINSSVFTNAGIYRYKVTEKNLGQAGITYNTNNKEYYVDLYIMRNDSAQLVCESVIAHDANTSYTSADSSGKELVADKCDLKFVNSFNAYHAVIEKEITGNQRDNTHTFKFNVTIGNLQSIRNIKINVMAADGTTKIGQTIVLSPQEGDTSVSTTEPIVLGKDQQIKIHGLYPDETYSVTETADDQQRGYKTRIDTGSFGNTDAGATGTWTVMADDEQNEHIFVNDKSGSVPTGLFINNWPYIAMMFVAAVIAVFMLKRRNSFEDDDL